MFPFEKFTDRAKKVLSIAKEVALASDSKVIDTIHVLVAIWQEGTSLACNILKNLNLQEEQFKQQLQVALGKTVTEAPTGTGRFPFTNSTKHMLASAAEEAKALGQNFMGTEHLLLGILHNEESDATKILVGFGISLDKARDELMGLMGEKVMPQPAGGQYKDDPDKVVNPKIVKRKTRETPNIDKYGVDLTELARNGKLGPCIGRHTERQRVLQILGRKTKNNPVLIGEPGTGKTSIVEGIALDIISGNAPESFRHKRVIGLDLPGMVAGTKYRGQFEERIKGLMKEIIDSGDVILFIDELHTMVGAGGSEGGMDASNILKPALSRGELQCIGATTLDEYRKHIEKDGALERRFQPIVVDPPTTDETLEILRGLQPSYEAHHNVKYTDASLKRAVTLAEKYITGRFLPDKAIDIIDEAGSKVKMASTFKPEIVQLKERELESAEKEMHQAVQQQKFEHAAKLRDTTKDLKIELADLVAKWKTDSIEEIDESVIANIVSSMTGIPLNQVTEEEKTRLLQIEQELHKHVISQDDAIVRVAQAIRRSRAGLKNPKQPIANFLFIGPTGVGKTLLCKKLAKFLFGSEEALIQIDMSEYMEKYNVSKLIGAPPGYVGYEEGGQLTEKVRRRPYAVILLDEIEKAHSDVFNMLLQIMEEGRLTDSFGRRIDFKNTILIMTSNLGSDLLKTGTGLGFSKSKEEHDEQSIKKTLMDEVEKTFRPEFINRLSDTVIFKSLNREDIRSIVDIEVIDLQNRLSDQHLELELTAEAKEYLITEGYSDVFGARPLKRAIEKYIENPLAEAILRGDFKDARGIQIVVVDEKLSFLPLSKN